MTLDQHVERLATRIQQLNDVISKDEFRDLVAGLRLNCSDVSEADHHQRGDTAPRSAEELRRKFHEDTNSGRLLRVGIIGRVKAGKSSLLNALLFEGKDVLPKAATPMTASLTVLGFSEKPYAEVEFFDSKDESDLRKYAQDYDREIERRVKERLDRAQTRPTKFGAGPRAGASLDPERIKASIRLELDADPTLGGSKDLLERIRQAGGLPGKTHQRIEGKDEQALLRKLGDYVGAEGKFTPFTKCMKIYLPLEPLRELEVVDTPGLNDPIVSREKRTFDELHKCHAVLVVSPSGQFLNSQDLDLMQRLVRQDGVEEVFLVASQIDSQMFSSERKRYGGKVLDVIEGLRNTLAQQARGTIPVPTSGGKGLETLKRELDARLVVTSSVAHTMVLQKEPAWDENTRHVHGMLRECYPKEFAGPLKASLPHLKAIAGIAQAQTLLAEVRSRRQVIIDSNLQSFLEAQEHTFNQRLKQIPLALKQQRAGVAEGDDDSLTEELQSVQKISRAGVQIVNTTVTQVASEMAEEAHDRLKEIVKATIDGLRRETDKSRGTTTRSYSRESDDFGSSAKRFFGKLFNQDDWGREQRTETVATLNVTAVRTTLDAVQSSLVDQFTSIISRARRTLRPLLETRILGDLRSHRGIDERDIDTSMLKWSCEEALTNLRDFDDPVLLPLPDELMQSGTLKGSAAERYEEEAREYFKSLEKNARAIARKLTTEFEKRLQASNIGSALFDKYEERIGSLKQQIKERENFLKRYDALIAEVEAIR